MLQPESQPENFHTSSTRDYRPASARIITHMAGLPTTRSAFCIHRQSSRQPALTGTDAPSPAAPKRERAQEPKLTTPIPESNPVCFCFQKQACFMQMGVHTVPQTCTPTHARPRTQTAYPSFLKESRVLGVGTASSSCSRVPGEDPSFGRIG